MQVVRNCGAKELLPILRGFSDLNKSVIYANCLKAYNGLVDYGAKEYYRVKHSKSEFANDKFHTNAIVNVWAYAKHRLNKLKGSTRINLLQF